MALQQYVINHLIHLLPPSRFYGVKNRIFRLAGVDVHPSARLISSVSIWGEMPLHIGADTFIGHDVTIIGSNARIEIGDNVDIAPRVCIVSGTHAIDMAGAHSAGQGLSKPIIIESGVWIGAGAIVVGGVTIGRKAIIGAGSVVVSDIPAMTMAAGNPCRLIKVWDESSEEWRKVLSNE